MTKRATYSDGDIEVELLELFEKTPLKKRESKIENILRESPSWPMMYHLSPRRENLLNWIDFPSEGAVLEVGAGCGALTGLLAKSFSHVTALELSERRNAINKARNKHHGNVEFISENLESFEKKGSFDYVVCVGVLEYAGVYLESADPHKTFLSQLFEFLKPGGSVVLAIENQHGLKYFSGAREDHTGRFYDGIEDYPIDTKIKTFGRGKLEALFTDCGFEDIEFYFPFPDYKMPSFVHGEKGVTDSAFFFPHSALPTASPDQSRLHIFSEQLAIDEIVDNGLYPHLANSFLVIAKGGK